MLDDDRAPPGEVLAALPIFPLPNAVLLPGMVLPLNVFEPRYVELVDHVLCAGGHIGVPLLCAEEGLNTGDNGLAGVTGIEPTFGVGRLLSHQRLPDGRRFIRLEGVRRVHTVAEHGSQRSFRELEVRLLVEDAPKDTVQLEVFKAQLERIAGTLHCDDAQLVSSILRIPDDRILIYAAAAIVPTLGLLPDRCDDQRSSLIDVQQRCLAAEHADGRVAALLECSAAICDVLSDTGRFPRTMLN